MNTIYNRPLGKYLLGEFLSKALRLLVLVDPRFALIAKRPSVISIITM